MRHKRRIIFLLAVLVISLLAFSSILNEAQAQSFPQKPIQIIVPYAPGGATDAGIRIIGHYLSAKWGVPVSVVNKTGGMGLPAILEVMNSSPDGYTMLGEGHPFFFILASKKDAPPVLFERTLVAKVFSVPVFYIVRADAPWKTLAEAIEYARKNPSAFKYGAGTLFSIDNFSITQLLWSSGIDSSAGRVIFDQGHSPSLAALLGGHVQFGIGMMPDIKSLYPSKVRALAVTSRERIKVFPDIPTTKEAGFPKANLVGWYGILGPPKLPKEITSLWEKTLSSAVNDPQFLDNAAKVGHLVRFVSQEEMAAEIKEELRIHTEMAEKAGLRE